MKKVAIILVNYKDYAQRFLADCRDSLRAQTYPKELFQVYIVDNASTPESRRYLGEKFGEAIIIPREDGNYAAANNAGIKRARQDGYGYFVIANMDVLLNKDWLKELVLAIDSEKQVGIAQSKILLYKGRKTKEKEKKINSLGNIINFLGFGYTDGYLQPDREIIGYPEIRGYASGCSFIVKKEVIEKINGYNEELYMYHDDLDIGWKTRLAGYKIILAPKSVVYHKYSFSRSVRMIYFMERNRYITVFTYYKCPTILLLLPALAVMELGMLAFSIVNKWFKIKLEVYKYFFKPSSWVKIFDERKKIKIIRKLTDQEVSENFSGKIVFQEIDNSVLKYIANPIFNLYWQVARRLIRW